jgi:TetR/AcrR family acrAB operon transcriptional repressor
MVRRTAEETAQTRARLLDAALEVFAEVGYSGAQIEEIARRAELTRGAFYHHFEDKAEAYAKVLEERWDRFMRPLFEKLAAAGEPRQRLRRFLVGFLTALEQDSSVKALLSMSFSGDITLPELKRHLHEKANAIEAWIDAVAAVLVEAGIPRARTRAIGVVAQIYGVATTWMLAPESFSPRAKAAELADSCLLGVLRP